MHKSNIKPHQLVLRCYAEKKGNQWLAFCLDFDLAAQADTPTEAISRLEAQMKSYVYDALVGEDREFAHQLLNRRAPLGKWIKFHFYKAVLQLVHSKKKNENHRPFCRPIPLVPVGA